MTPPRSTSDVERDVIEKALVLRAVVECLSPYVRERFLKEMPEPLHAAWLELDGQIGLLRWMRKTGRKTNEV
jgi:hypothetical protein